MNTTPLPEKKTLPSIETCQRAAQTWRRIQNRFEMSSVWRLAPPEVVATEFISLLRFTLAPLRVECALYDYSGHPSLIAATLPTHLLPTAVDSQLPPQGIRFSTAAFFAEGGAAAKSWIDSLSPNQDDALKGVIKSYGMHLSRFPKPDRIPLTTDGSICLHLLVDHPYGSDVVTQLVHDSGVVKLLRRHRNESPDFEGAWQPMTRRITDYFVYEFLDRTENDLAVLTGGQPSDIWVLLPNESGNSLKFHAPRQKLDRLLDHYNIPGSRIMAVSGLCGNRLKGIKKQGTSGNISPPATADTIDIFPPVGPTHRSSRQIISSVSQKSFRVGLWIGASLAVL